MDHQYAIDASEMFTLFFVMLGPLKILGPFAKLSQTMEPAALRDLAYRAVLIATCSLVIGGLVGCGLLKNWHISIPVLALTGGLIFLITAFLIIFRPTLETSLPPVITPQSIAFSMIVTPYGAAVLIALLSLSADSSRYALIFGMLFVILVLDLLSMLFIRQIMGKIGSITLMMLGAVLSVLQAAHAMQIIVDALKMFQGT